jgi:hypothetical protein
MLPVVMAVLYLWFTRVRAKPPAGSVAYQTWLEQQEMVEDSTSSSDRDDS